MNSLLSANIACLQQGIELLELIPQADYSRASADVFGSTIGGHVRHNLDHYAVFLAGFKAGEVDYDARERDIRIEEDPEAAKGLMRKLIDRLQILECEELESSLLVRMDDGGDSSWSRTSLRRELQFLLSHSIHHYALRTAIAARYGFKDVPEGFGVAPATLHHQAQKWA